MLTRPMYAVKIKYLTDSIRNTQNRVLSSLFSICHRNRAGFYLFPILGVNQNLVEINTRRHQVAILVLPVPIAFYTARGGSVAALFSVRDAIISGGEVFIDKRRDKAAAAVEDIDGNLRAGNVGESEFYNGEVIPVVSVRRENLRNRLHIRQHFILDRGCHNPPVSRGALVKLDRTGVVVVCGVATSVQRRWCSR